jgi:hypothetical protein
MTVVTWLEDEPEHVWAAILGAHRSKLLRLVPDEMHGSHV